MILNSCRRSAFVCLCLCITPVVDHEIIVTIFDHTVTLQHKVILDFACVFRSSYSDVGAGVEITCVCVCSINRKRNGTGLGMLSSCGKTNFSFLPSVPLTISPPPCETGAIWWGWKEQFQDEREKEEMWGDEKKGERESLFSFTVELLLIPFLSALSSCVQCWYFTDKWWTFST